MSCVALLSFAGCGPYATASELRRLSLRPGAVVERGPTGEIERVRVRTTLDGFGRGLVWGMSIGVLPGVIGGVALTYDEPSNQSGDCPSNRDCDGQKVIVPILLGATTALIGGIIGGSIGAARRVEVTYELRR